MYSYVVSAHQGGKILQTPVNGKYHYLFGDYFLVAPIYKDAFENEVVLPGGKWYYMFDDSKTITGPKKIKMEFPLDEFPVFIKAGAIIPMHIERSYTGYGSQATSDYMTVLIYPNEESTFTVHHPDGNGSTDIRVSETDEKISVQLSGQKKQHILRIHMEKPPVKVLLDQQELNKTEDYIYDQSAHKLIITTDIYRNGQYDILK
jgi:alpha-glucosidase (family GH31 glycosyl hydrolase)